MAEEIKTEAVEAQEETSAKTETAEKKENGSKKAEPAKKKSFFKGVKAEFKKIIWPAKAVVAKETGAVIFFSIVLGVLIAAIDAVLKYGLGFIL